MPGQDFFRLRLVRPEFDDSLTDLILELDHQRKYVLGGTTPPQLFFQLKQMFHIVESLGSARIEGNGPPSPNGLTRKPPCGSQLKRCGKS